MLRGLCAPHVSRVMSAVQVATMRREEIPGELFHLPIEDYLQRKPEDDMLIQTGLIMEDLCEPFAIHTDGNPLSMFPEGVISTPSPMNWSSSPPPYASTVADLSPSPSACSSPPFPATRSNSPSTSPKGLSRPGTPRGKKSPGSPATDGLKPQKIPRHRRQSHINAEHRRRSKIQIGFRDLQNFVPSIAESVANNVKESKAAMLNKTSEHIRQLSAEHNTLQREANQLRQEMEALSSEVNTICQQLPSSGVEAPTFADPSKVEQMFRDYTSARTCQNWKFFMFGLIAKPLFESYNQTVQTTSYDVFQDTTLTWQERKCSLTNLRPIVLQSLRELNNCTSIMTNPERLQGEVFAQLFKDISVGDASTVPTTAPTAPGTTSTQQDPGSTPVS